MQKKRGREGKIGREKISDGGKDETDKMKERKDGVKREREIEGEKMREIE